MATFVVTRGGNPGINLMDLPTPEDCLQSAVLWNQFSKHVRRRDDRDLAVEISNFLRISFVRLREAAKEDRAEEIRLRIEASRSPSIVAQLDREIRGRITW